MMTPDAARDLLMQQPWPRGVKREEWLRKKAKDTGLTYSAVWGLVYRRRKRLYADEAALIAAYVQEANEPIRSQRAWESSYDQFAQRAGRHDGVNTASIGPDASDARPAAVRGNAARGDRAGIADEIAAGCAPAGLEE